MATEPTFNLVVDYSYTTMVEVGESMVFGYVLYAEDDQFEAWTEWVNDSINSPTFKDEYNADNYSGYVIKVKCVAEEGSTNYNNACCLMTSTTDAMGGWCLLNEGDATFSTYSMTGAQYANFLDSTPHADYATITANGSLELAADSNNIEYF